MPSPSGRPAAAGTGAYSERRTLLRVPVVEETTAGARRLGEAYWQEVAAYSRGLVRPRRAVDGVDLVLLRVLPLLRFGGAEATVGAGLVQCRYPIRGGILASGPGGFLVLSQHSRETVELSLAVHDYRARLAVEGRLGARRRLFERLQVPLHERVSRRFLERAAAQGSL